MTAIENLLWFSAFVMAVSTYMTFRTTTPKEFYRAAKEALTPSHGTVILCLLVAGSVCMLRGAEAVFSPSTFDPEKEAVVYRGEARGTLKSFWSKGVREYYWIEFSQGPEFLLSKKRWYLSSSVYDYELRDYLKRRTGSTFRIESGASTLLVVEYCTSENNCTKLQDQPLMKKSIQRSTAFGRKVFWFGICIFGVGGVLWARYLLVQRRKSLPAS